MTGVSGMIRNMGVSVRWCRRIKDEEEAAEVNQVQQVGLATGQLQSTPLTPPVAQGRVPAELRPLAQIPSFMASLPPVQPSVRQQPPPPPRPGPPPSEESPEISQPVTQSAQPEPSVP